MEQRLEALGESFAQQAFPVEYYSLGGLGPGAPIRVTVSDFGPLLLAKILDANKTQEQSLSLLFHYADQKGLPLVDLSDLRAMLQFLDSDEGRVELKGIGGVSSATVGVLLRALVQVEDGGGNELFGEPQLDINDLIRTDADGRGVISLLELGDVRDKPLLWSTATMWLLGELFETLPEVGDLPKPKLVFFFDEAHLLFKDASQGVRRGGCRHGAAHPLEGSRRVLRHPDAEGCARGRSRPARQPRAARVARAHAGRRDGAARRRAHVPEVGGLRPGATTAAARHRRGCRHGARRAGRSDACRAHEYPAAALEARADGQRRRGGEGVADVREVRHTHRQGERAGDACETSRASHGLGREGSATAEADPTTEAEAAGAQ